MAKPPVDDTPAEFSFKFRRVLAFGWIIFNSLLLLLIILKIDEARQLMWVAVCLTVANIFVALFYMGGASATDIGQIMQGLASVRQRRRRSYGGYGYGYNDDDDEDGGDGGEPIPTAPDGKPI